MKLAVIPARGGSKRIPQKNIKSFCGQPMIAWSIHQAQAAQCFDHIIVSTDNDQIAAIARDYGAEVPFMRPAELSGDHVGTIPVIKHAIEQFSTSAEYPHAVCCIYPTAPFIRAHDIQKGLLILQQHPVDYVFSITSYAFPIQRALRQDSHHHINMFQPNEFSTRSQDLESAWHDAGQFYWGKTAAWLAEKPLFNSSAQGVILPRYRVQDIDVLEDWHYAELMYEVLKKHPELP